MFTAGFSARAQLYSNDFENQYTWYPPWTNIRIAVDSTALEGTYVCSCDTTQEYGLGIAIEAGKLYPLQNINIRYEFLFKTETRSPQAEIVFSIDDETGNKYWNSYPLSGFVNDTAVWSLMSLDLNFPFDYVGKGRIITYIWNRGRENLWFDNAKITVTPWTMPSYLPNIEADAVGIVEEYILNGDTITEYNPFNGNDCPCSGVGLRQ